MLDQHPEAVVHDVPLRLVAPGDTLLLTATLRYEASDPYAVEATFRAGDEAISWVLGRDLLRDGLEAESGEGDVHVWPTDEDADPLDDEDGADVVALSSVRGRTDDVDDEGSLGGVTGLDEPGVMIELCSPDGRALLAAAASDVRHFLSSSYAAVPAGEEHLHLDVDHAIERLLA
ncbi:SsgA family sporulation/cell division regulator [Angustibacter aerolatus]